MSMQTHVSKVLWYETIGFLAVIAFSWINELSDLPQFLTNTQYVPNWRESALETLVITLVAIPVMVFTKRLVSRLYYLENFLRMCSWCRKIELDDKWIPLEEFFTNKFKTETSHGICPECMIKLKADMNRHNAPLVHSSEA